MKKKLISIFTLIFIVSMITTVYAATGSISAGASIDTVIKGKNFTVTIAGTADNNITAMQAKLTYDTNKLAIESKSAGTGFSDLSGNNEIAIASTSNESLSKSGTLYTITFKVLDTAEEGETTIKVTGATLALVNENSEQENLNVTDEDVTITIKADDTTVGNQGGTNSGEQTPGETENDGSNGGAQDGNPSNSGNNGGNTDDNKPNSGSEDKNTNKDKNVNTNKNTNKKPTKLPQTGAESASIIAIIVLGAISIASYVSYRRYKNI